MLFGLFGSGKDSPPKFENDDQVYYNGWTGTFLARVVQYSGANSDGHFYIIQYSGHYDEVHEDSLRKVRNT